MESKLKLLFFLYIFQAELLENLLSEAEQVHIRRKEASEMLQVCFMSVFSPEFGRKTYFYLTAKLENATGKFFILFIILGN